MRAGGNRIVCEPSYVPVENLVFGRLAFKGFFSSWHWRNVKQSDTLIVPPPLFTTSCCRDECRNWGDDGGKQGGDGGEPGGGRCVSGGDGNQVGFGYNHTSDKVRKEITSRSVHKGLMQQETKINAIHCRLAQNMGKKFASKRDKSGKKPTINKWVSCGMMWNSNSYINASGSVNQVHQPKDSWNREVCKNVGVKLRQGFLHTSLCHHLDKTRQHWWKTPIQEPGNSRPLFSGPDLLFPGGSEGGVGQCQETKIQRIYQTQGWRLNPPPSPRSLIYLWCVQLFCELLKLNMPEINWPSFTVHRMNYIYCPTI